jgi:hypothetical protein
MQSQSSFAISNVLAHRAVKGFPKKSAEAIYVNYDR